VLPVANGRKKTKSSGEMWPNLPKNLPPKPVKKKTEETTTVSNNPPQVKKRGETVAKTVEKLSIQVSIKGDKGKEEQKPVSTILQG